MKKHLIKIYEWLRRRYLLLWRRLVKPRRPQNLDGKVYVNVGCGDDSGKEFINVDVLGYPNVHYVHDITDLSMFPDESVDMIYASHVVEHLPRGRFKSTLREWQRVLKPGGIFRFAVPDFDNLIKVYKAEGCNVDIIRDQVLGQNPPYNNHHSLWNWQKAEQVLTELGFINIRRWSPETAAHHDFKDRSNRMLKAGKEQVLLSLNVEAEKI